MTCHNKKYTIGTMPGSIFFMMMTLTLLSIFIIPMAHGKGTDSKLSQQAVKLLTTGHTESWQAQVISAFHPQEISLLYDQLENEDWSSLEGLLEPCLQPVPNRIEYLCHLQYQTLATIEPNYRSRLARWLEWNPQSPHPVYILAISMNQQADLLTLTTNKLAEDSMSDSLADIFRDIARHDLLTLVRKYPGWSHPAAELIRSSDPANPAQKNLINRLLTAQSQQSIKPNLPVLAALEKLTPRKDGSYAEITRVISLWQKGTNSAENITWLQAWQDTQKGLDALTGFQQQQSYADSYVFFNSAWQSGFRSPELLLTYGRRNPGKNIQSDYGVWQQAAWMASPASVSDLIRLAESSEQYDAVPGFAEKLALQFPGSAVANWWASDQLNDINRTESEKYASFALSLSPWHPVIRKQAKKAQLELPDYIDNSQYLVEVIRPALAYWTLTSNYLQDRASSVSPDLTSGHLLRVETPENFEVQFKLALDESTLRPVQINYLADHLQKQREIAMVKPDQLNHNLSKEIEARTLNQVNRILGQLQTEMYQSYSQFATEYAGHCLANCKWFTANQ